MPRTAPLVIAGDFNDWTQHAQQGFARPLGLHEVFEAAHGRLARSFPAALPVLQLDRIYVRGFSVKQARVHHGHAVGAHFGPRGAELDAETRL